MNFVFSADYRNHRRDRLDLLERQAHDAFVELGTDGLPVNVEKSTGDVAHGFSRLQLIDLHRAYKPAPNDGGVVCDLADAQHRLGRRARDLERGVNRAVAQQYVAHLAGLDDGRNIEVMDARAELVAH